MVHVTPWWRFLLQSPWMFPHPGEEYENDSNRKVTWRFLSFGRLWVKTLPLKTMDGQRKTILFSYWVHRSLFRGELTVKLREGKIWPYPKRWSLEGRAADAALHSRHAEVLFYVDFFRRKQVPNTNHFCNAPRLLEKWIMWWCTFLWTYIRVSTYQCRSLKILGHIGNSNPFTCCNAYLDDDVQNFSPSLMVSKNTPFQKTNFHRSCKQEIPSRLFVCLVGGLGLFCFVLFVYLLVCFWKGITLSEI